MSTEINYGPIKKLVTPEIPKETLVLPEAYIDADDELKPIAEFVKNTTQHNSSVKPERIKYLYTTKPKKEAGKYSIGDLLLRSKMEKMVDDTFDYIITVYYPVWKGLDAESKVIQMDKLLCGVDLGNLEEEKLKKRQKNTREFSDNLFFFGPEIVLANSDMVNLATCSAIEKQKEEIKKLKEGRMQDANELDEEGVTVEGDVDAEEDN